MQQLCLLLNQLKNPPLYTYWPGGACLDTNKISTPHDLAPKLNHLLVAFLGAFV